MSFTIELDILLVKKWHYICYIFSHYYAKTKVDSYDSLPLEKTLALNNVIIFIKSVFNKDKNHSYYNIFLEKYSYKHDTL